MMLAPVLVIMSFALAKRKSSTNGGKAEKSKITIPWFAFGFIGIICLNSLLQYILGVDSVKEIPLNGAIEYIDTFMLTMAMTALVQIPVSRNSNKQVQNHSCWQDCCISAGRRWLFC